MGNCKQGRNAEKRHSFRIIRASLQCQIISLHTDSQYNEPQLLIQIASGDQIAFSHIVTKYTSVVYGHLLTYLKNTQSAEEITQDIFLNIWKHRKELPAISNFPGYVYIMTRNRAYTAFRNKLYAKTEPVEDVLQTLFTNPESKLELKELTDALNKGIESLPPRRKEVFRLSRLQEYEL